MKASKFFKLKAALVEMISHFVEEVKQEEEIAIAPKTTKKKITNEKQ